MRKIKVGALQPGYLPVPPEFDCMGDAYVADAQAITERYVKKQLDITLGLLERAGREGCGIVTTCEDACGTSYYCVDTTERNIYPQLLELSAPLAEEGFSNIARRHGMYVVGCYNKRVGGRNYNVASLFDRSGVIVWEYRKTHLPAYEGWQGTPGDRLDSFKTDFGKIGVCICYDMMFPECTQAVALSGAEVIFHPTAGYGWYDSIGEATLRTRANDNSVYLVTAKNYVFNAAGKSSVIDHWGQVLADAGFYRDVIVTKEIDLDMPKTQPEWHYPTQTSGIPNLRERNLRERRPELYGALAQRQREPAPLDLEAQLRVIENIRNGKCRW